MGQPHFFLVSRQIFAYSEILQAIAGDNLTASEDSTRRTFAKQRRQHER